MNIFGKIFEGFEIIWDNFCLIWEILRLFDTFFACFELNLVLVRNQMIFHLFGILAFFDQFFRNIFALFFGKFRQFEAFLGLLYILD